MLAVFDWRMALAMFITVPVGFLVSYVSRGIQRRLGKKHAESKLKASGQVQEYLEEIKVILACGLGEQVMAATKAACCDEFVNKLPNGYETMLGENGNTLSRGERQRLSIARVLLKDARIVLLDEATASLDPENEYLIQQAISQLIAGRTVIVR